MVTIFSQTCSPRSWFMTASPIDVYRRQIEKELQAGNATEHTHRPALKTLLEALAPKVTATNEPKRVECGAPDYAVTEKRAHGPVTIGHLEAKDVGKDLDEIEKSEQMKRYLPALPNLILTDHLGFRGSIAISTSSGSVSWPLRSRKTAALPSALRLRLTMLFAKR